MSTFGFAPALGWIGGSLVAAVMVACAVTCVVLHARRGADGTDETLWSCVRRVLACVIVALMAFTPSMVTKTTSRAISTTDVVIVSDITPSMGVQDARYGSKSDLSRLEAAKSAIADIVRDYPIRVSPQYPLEHRERWMCR